MDKNSFHESTEIMNWVIIDAKFEISENSPQMDRIKKHWNEK